MTEIEHRVRDLISFSSSQQPLEFNNAFSALIGPRVEQAIADRKVEVAGRLFNNQPIAAEDGGDEDA